MRVIFFGTPNFVIPILEILLKEYDIVGIVTTHDTIQGRKKIVTPSPVKQFILDQHLSIPVFTFKQFTDEIVKQIQELKPDLFVVAAYGKIIPSSILNLPKYGALNIHPSLLPKYRGPSPIQSAILNGDSITGVTIIKMDEKMDHGPIIAQKELPITANDTFVSLHEALFSLAAKMLPESITQYIKDPQMPKEQNDTQATFCKIIKKEDGYFSLASPPTSEKLDRMIRAYYPWPTAWTKWQMANGTTRALSSSKGHKWQMAKFLPERKIQVEGGKPMNIKEFLNGYPEMKQKIVQLGLMTND